MVKCNKKIYIFLFVFIFVVSICTTARAATEDPTSTDNSASTTQTSEPIPTQPPNIIKSIGDFNLYAEYIDGTKVEENAAINVTILGDEAFTEEIISSIRGQNGNQDIFIIFTLELQQNGRPMRQHTPVDLFIDNAGIFTEYENLNFYKIKEDNSASRFEVTQNEQYIMFEADELGKYVVCGEKKGEELATDEPQQTAPLQDDTQTSIIPTIGPTKTPEGDNVVTAGAFVFWLVVALILGLWIGLGIGFVIWGRYRNKKNNRGPFVIGE